MSALRSGRPRPLRFESLETRLALTAWYVSPLGDNAQDGSALAPWKTLQKAAAVVLPGDTVNVAAGNYAGFDLRRSGVSSAPITFRAQPGAVISSRNPVTPDGINLEGASYVVVEGFKINAMPRAGIRSVTNQHVTILNNQLDRNYAWGIFTGFSDDLLIEGNVASRSQTQHGIYVSNSGDRPVIRNNSVWGNSGSGIHLNGDATMGGDGIISGAVVEGNTVHDNGYRGGSGINADGMQQGRIQNNLLYNNHASGIALFRQDGGGPSSANLVINNTVAQPADGRWALAIQNASTSNLVVNNILYNAHAVRGSIDISSDSLSGFRSNNNVLTNRMTTSGGASLLTLAQWRAATGQDQQSLVKAPDELFVGFVSNDFHLSLSSPAIDAGTSQNAPLRDLQGAARPSGQGWDIGAFERQSSQASLQPIDDSDATFSTAGAWTAYPGQGYQNTMHYAGLGSGLSVATWTAQVTPGQYEVAVTWYADPNRASNAPFTVLDGNLTRGTTLVNQRLSPGDFSESGVSWKKLGIYTVSGTTLVVKLTNLANGYVIADAIRIVPVSVAASDVQPILLANSAAPTAEAHPDDTTDPEKTSEPQRVRRLSLARIPPQFNNAATSFEPILGAQPVTSKEPAKSPKIGDPRQTDEFWEDLLEELAM
jgi:parallel beta-helix repeat protein